MAGRQNPKPTTAQPRVVLHIEQTVLCQLNEAKIALHRVQSVLLEPPARYHRARLVKMLDGVNVNEERIAQLPIDSALVCLPPFRRNRSFVADPAQVISRANAMTNSLLVRNTIDAIRSHLQPPGMHTNHLNTLAWLYFIAYIAGRPLNGFVEMAYTSERSLFSR